MDTYESPKLMPLSDLEMDAYNGGGAVVPVVAVAAAVVLVVAAAGAGVVAAAGAGIYLAVVYVQTVTITK